jgi:hypothetical protein
MTEDQALEIHARANELRMEIQVRAREMFAHFESLGMPPTMVLLTPDGDDSIHDICLARQGARRELDELTAELRTRERQLVYVTAQRTPINLEELSDAEAACCAQIVSGAFNLQKRAPGRLIVIDPANGALFFAGPPAGGL